MDIHRVYMASEDLQAIFRGYTLPKGQLEYQYSDGLISLR